MEHDNIDKEIKKKLEGRLLAPSHLAWDKLDSLLENEKKQTKKGMPFYWVAASIMLLLGLFFVFKEGDRGDGVLIAPVIVEEAKAIERDVIGSSKQEYPLQEIVLEQAEEVIVDKNLKRNSVEQFLKRKKEGLPNISDMNDLGIQKEEALMAVSEADDSQRDSYNKNLDFEVDSLLAIATASIEQKTEKEPKVINTTIDANALLSDVEEELDLSFKERVFTKIKSGFKKSKTAVAKRND